MLEVSRIREEKDVIIERLKVRNIDVSEKLEEVLSLDTKRKETQLVMDNDLTELNSLSKEIGNLFKSGKIEEVEDRITDRFLTKYD